MDRYEQFLKKLNKAELKKIVKTLLKHVEIKLTGISKQELIEHLLKHTMYENGEIVTRSDLIDNLDLEEIVSDLPDKLKKDALTDKQIKDKIEKTLKEIGKVSGMISNKERRYNDLVYESVIYGKKSDTLREMNEADKAESDKLKKELDLHKKKLKMLRMQLKALQGYKTGVKEDMKEVKKKEIKKKEVKKEIEKEVKKMEDEEYEGDDEFKRKKVLVGLKAKFDRLKGELENEKDMKKKKLLELEIQKVKDEYSKISKKKS